MRALAIAVVASCIAACSSGSDSGGSGGTNDPDADRDGFLASADCNDTDAAAWRTISVFADTDADGVGADQAISRCAGNATPAGFSTTSTDCAPNDPAIHTLMPYAARDADGDTVLIASAGSICGDGATLPARYFASAGSSAADCDDQSAAVWRLANLHEDFDRDAIGYGAQQSLCVGNGTPPGYSESSFDCDDRNGTKWRMVAIYSDVDGDGVGSGPIQALCTGSGPPPFGSSFLGFDPLDTLADPDSALVSDFDLDLQRLIVDSDGDDDDIP